LTTDRDRTTPRPSPLAVWLSVALTGGALNFATALLARPRGLREGSWPLDAFLLSVSATAALSAGGAMLLLAGRRWASPHAVLGCGIAAAVGFAFAPVAARGGALEIACVAVAAIASGMAVSRGLMRLAAQQGRFDLAAALVHASPWVAVATALAIWAHIYAIGPVASAAGLATTAGWALACAALVAGMARVSRRALWPAASAAALVAALAVGAPRERAAEGGPSAGAPQRCAVLLTVDTLRADALRAFNPDAAANPVLDAWLEEAVVFTQARSAAPWTRPAFASMHTGLSIAAHGTRAVEDVLPPEARTLAERFAEAGFATAAVGDNANVGADFGFAQGFQRFDMYPQPDLGNSLGAKLATRLGLHSMSGRTDLLTDRAIAQVEALRGQSFFLWLHYFDPHMNYGPPGEFQPPGTPPARVGREWKLGEDLRTGLFLPTDEERRWIRALYDGELRWVDASIGRFFEALRKTGLDQRCVIAFSSDHGEEFWEHGRTQHGHALYDESIRVPLAFRLPGANERGHVTVPVSTQQIPATLMEVMGIPVPEIEAIAPTLAPLWGSSKSAPQNPPTVSTGMLYDGDQIATVSERWKVIRKAASGERTVFDLVADPREQHPVPDAAAAIAAADEIERVWLEQAARARQVFRIPERSGATLDEHAREQLRALGYVQ